MLEQPLFLIRTWGLVFSTVPGDLAVGVWESHCFNSGTLYGNHISRLLQNFSFEIEANCLRTKQISRITKNYSVLAGDLCVCAYVYPKGEHASLLCAAALSKTTLRNYAQ